MALAIAARLLYHGNEPGVLTRFTDTKNLIFLSVKTRQRIISFICLVDLLSFESLHSIQSLIDEKPQLRLFFMKDTLLLIGELLNIVFSIVALPVLIAAECFIGLLIAIRYARVVKKRISKIRFRYPEPVHQFLLRSHLLIYKK